MTVKSLIAIVRNFLRMYGNTNVVILNEQGEYTLIHRVAGRKNFVVLLTKDQSLPD